MRDKIPSSPLKHTHHRTEAQPTASWEIARRLTHDAKERPINHKNNQNILPSPPSHSFLLFFFLFPKITLITGSSKQPNICLAEFQADDSNFKLTTINHSWSLKPFGLTLVTRTQGTFVAQSYKAHTMHSCLAAWLALGCAPEAGN